MPESDWLSYCVEHVEDNKKRKERVHEKSHKVHFAFDCLFIPLSGLIGHYWILIYYNVFVPSLNFAMIPK